VAALLAACGGGGGGGTADVAAGSTVLFPTSSLAGGTAWDDALRIGSGAAAGAPSIARLASGLNAVAWISDAGGNHTLRVHRHGDNGLALGSPLVVQANAGQSFAGVSIRAIGGGAALTWCAHTDRGIDAVTGLPRPGWDSYLLRLDGIASPAAAPVQLNAQPGGTCSEPVAAAWSDGLVVARREAGAAPGCVFMMYGANGVFARMADLPGAARCTVAALPDGGFAAAEEREHAGAANRVHLHRFDTAGTLASSQAIDGAAGVGPGAHRPAIATLADGNVALAWASDGAGLVAQTFTPDGVAISARAVADASGAAANHFGAQGIAAGSGGFALAWTAAGQAWTQRFGADGVALESATAVGTAVAGSASAAAGDGGGMLFGWQAGAGAQDVFVRRR
jgi:hypothetical protein